jgi:hypothetical protein
MSLKPTYSNVISTLCLFLLLGGGAAYAASNLPKNSVGTAQLRRHSVAAGKLAPQSVGNGALTKGIRTRLNKGGPVGPHGPSGSPGATGAQGPGAVRLHLSENGTESATPQSIGIVGGLTLKAACKTTKGETGLVFSAKAQEAGVIQENFQNDTGSDPHTPGTPQAGNLQFELLAGESTLGGAPAVSSGTYFRTIASLIAMFPTQTISIEIAAVTEGTAAHCSVDGTAVLATD